MYIKKKHEVWKIMMKKRKILTYFRNISPDRFGVEGKLYAVSLKRKHMIISIVAGIRYRFVRKHFKRKNIYIFFLHKTSFTTELYKTFTSKLNIGNLYIRLEYKSFKIIKRK